MNTFESKNVLIVGGSSGIGAATAKAFAELGALVTIASRNQEKLDASAAEIKSSVGSTVQTAVLDTGDEAAVERFFAQTGPFDHVVVSAAQTPVAPHARSHSPMRTPPWTASFGAHIALRVP
jgi:NAD(P)-dependent dehydrogenase (short-subunit alcohol dehydrogenase family)